MKRMLNKRTYAKSFNRQAQRTKAINVMTPSFRGGIRL